MSLQAAAKHLATHGRGPDTHLIHMSGKELRGLQDIAKAGGTSLTINPKTGLPEAGMLDRLMPAIVGAAATYFSGGAITPQMAGMGIGALQAGRTGDLRQGLMAGLGAYGGASLGGMGLESAGAGGINANIPVEDRLLSSSSTPPPDVFAGPQPNTAPLPTSGDVGMDRMLGADGMTNPTFSQNPADYSGFDATRANPGAFGEERLTGFEGRQFEPRPGVTPENYGQGYDGPNKATSLKPEGAATSDKFNTKALVGGMLASSMLNRPKTSGTPRYSAPTPRYSFNQQSGQYTRMAVGGMAGGGGMFNYSGDTGPVVGMRSGGLSDLGGYSDGGRLLKGPGDGVSDSIPAMIGNKQPARLADGEFVVPARIVSEIGNGSTEAGARKLYAMMDRVQKARSKTTGKKQVAKNTRADKYLPA
jgi:hypothetical protein